MFDTEQDGAPGAEPTISRADIAHLARLAVLDVTDEELDTYAQQLDVILTSVAKVSQAPIASAEPTSHAVTLVNVFRDDVVESGLTVEQALAMAPAAEADRFRVPQILGEEQ